MFLILKIIRIIIYFSFFIINLYYCFNQVNFNIYSKYIHWTWPLFFCMHNFYLFYTILKLNPFYYSSPFMFDALSLCILFSFISYPIAGPIAGLFD